MIFSICQQLLENIGKSWNKGNVNTVHAIMLLFCFEKNDLITHLQKVCDSLNSTFQITSFEIWIWNAMHFLNWKNNLLHEQEPYMVNEIKRIFLTLTIYRRVTQYCIVSRIKRSLKLKKESMAICSTIDKSITCLQIFLSENIEGLTIFQNVFDALHI